MDTNFTARVRQKGFVGEEGEHALKRALTWLLAAALGALLQSATLSFSSHPFGVAFAGASTNVFFPATALGVAFAAAVGTGFAKWEQAERLFTVKQHYTPGNMTDVERASLLTGWHRAVERAKGWRE